LVLFSLEELGLLENFVFSVFITSSIASFYAYYFVLFTLRSRYLCYALCFRGFVLTTMINKHSLMILKDGRISCF